MKYGLSGNREALSLHRWFRMVQPAVASNDRACRCLCRAGQNSTGTRARAAYAWARGRLTAPEVHALTATSREDCSVHAN